MIRDKAVQSLRGEVCKVRSAAVSRNGGLTMHELSSSQSLGNGTWHIQQSSSPRSLYIHY
jgi:hypothetical protein